MNEQFIHGGNIYAKRTAGTWLDFSANINPLGLSPATAETLRAHIGDVIHYPDPKGTALKEALCRHYQVDTDQLLLGNGAAELLYVYFHTYRHQRLLLPVPSFSEYERAGRAGDAQISYLYLSEKDDFAVPWQVLEGRLAAADVVVLGNPNNPTGVLSTTDELLPLVAAAQKMGTTVIVDESFLDFLDDKPYSLIPYVAQYDNLIVLRSLTKCFALPGLRLGFAVMAPQRAALLEAHKDCWNVNVLAQAAGVTALGDGFFLEKTRAFVTAEKEWLFSQLQSLPDLYVFSPAVNFILLRLGKTWGDAAAVCAGLKEQGILLRNCQYYPGLTAQYIRAAVWTRAENQSLLQGLQLYYDGRNDA